MTAHYVSEEECRKMNELHDEAIPAVRIAEAFDRAEETVCRHIRDRCQHRGGGRRQTPDKAVLLNGIEDLAEEIEKIPASSDWDGWENRPCVSGTVLEEFGVMSWKEILDKTDLPRIAEGSPDHIRAIAYQKPDLCTHPCETDD